MQRSQELMSKYCGWSGLCPASHHVDPIGVFTRHSYDSGFETHRHIVCDESSPPTYVIKQPVIPVNDCYFEYLAILASVDEARDSFTMIELGAGFGRWSVVAAVAMRKKLQPLAKRLIAVEADLGHVSMLHTHFQDNGVDSGDYTVISKAIAPKNGTAKFTMGASSEWYGQRIIGENELEKERECLNRNFPNAEITEVQTVTLNSILKEESCVDLLDMDIQGIEFDIVAASKDLIHSKVKRVFIGTHGSRQEQGLREIFSELGWFKIFDYHCGSLVPFQENVTISFEDGVQYWVNPNFSQNIPTGSRVYQGVNINTETSKFKDQNKSFSAMSSFSLSNLMRNEYCLSQKKDAVFLEQAFDENAEYLRYYCTNIFPDGIADLPDKEIALRVARYLADVLRHDEYSGSGTKVLQNNGAWCSGHATAAVALLRSLNFQARLVYFHIPTNSHMAIEVFFDGKWCYLDPYIGAFFNSTSGAQRGIIASFQELFSGDDFSCCFFAPSAKSGIPSFEPIEISLTTSNEFILEQLHVYKDLANNVTFHSLMTHSICSLPLLLDFTSRNKIVFGKAEGSWQDIAYGNTRTSSFDMGYDGTPRIHAVNVLAESHGFVTLTYTVMEDVAPMMLVQPLYETEVLNIHYDRKNATIRLRVRNKNSTFLVTTSGYCRIAMIQALFTEDLRQAAWHGL